MIGTIVAPFARILTNFGPSCATMRRDRGPAELPGVLVLVQEIQCVHEYRTSGRKGGCPKRFHQDRATDTHVAGEPS